MSRKIIDEVKRELLAEEIGGCCSYAFLSGAIRGAGELGFTFKGFALTFRHDDRAFVEKISSVIEKTFGEKFIVEETYIDMAIKKGTTYVLAIPAETAVGILERCEIVRSRCELVSTLPRTLVGRKCCQKAYLAGLFLSCGYLGVPDQINEWTGGKSRCGYSLEYKLNSDIIMEPIKKLIKKAAFLEDNSVLTRKRGSVIYVKNAEAIAKVLTATGSNVGVMSLQEIVLERQMKNRINRVNNFDLANIDKSVNASEKQINDIKYIDRKIGIDSLPPALAETCRMRLAYPDAGLEELGKAFDPPISKSCINHRMRKLASIATEIR